MWYKIGMSKARRSPNLPVDAHARLDDRLRNAMIVQAIEENPLDDEQVAMFLMFDRQNWSHERRRAHLMERVSSRRAEVVD